MTKTFYLPTSELLDIVKRSLSIIGKRAVDDNGNTLFETLTPSTLEEPIFTDFFRTAVTSVVTEIRKFIDGVTVMIGGIDYTYPFDLIDNDVTMVEENQGLSPVPENAQIIFADDPALDPTGRNHKFYIRVPDEEYPGEYIYYPAWEGSTENYQDSSHNYKPYANKYYECNDTIYEWNGTTLVVVTPDQSEVTRIILELANDYNEALDQTVKQALQAYCVAYALYSWFVITSPRLADKYLADANAHRSFVISQLFHRKAPATLTPSHFRPPSS